MKWLWMSLLLTACNTDTKTDDDESADETPSESEDPTESEVESQCSTDGECEAWEICETDVCEPGDRNNDLTEAESLLWEELTSAYVNVEGDVDYYTFEADGGEFVKISTIVDSGDEDLDTMLVVRNPAGQVHYTAYDYPTGGKLSTLDAVAYIYLPEGGTWSIAVEHDSSTDTDPDYGGDYSYDLTLAEWTVHTDEDDTFDDASLSITPTDGSYWPIGVALEEEGDIDYVDIAFPYDGGVFYTVGMAELGSSEATPLVTLTDEENEVWSERENVGPDGYLAYPSLPNDVYSLQLSDADGGGSKDHWYFVFLRTYEESSAYPYEEESNDSVEEANPIDWYETKFSSGEPYFIGWIQGILDTDGDADYISLEFSDEGSLVACANSASQGSSAAVDLTLLDPDGEEVETAAGDADADPTAELENIEVDEGTYTLRISDDEATGGPQAFYRTRLVYAPNSSFTSWSCP